MRRPDILFKYAVDDPVECSYPTTLKNGEKSSQYFPAYVNRHIVAAANVPYYDVYFIEDGYKMYEQHESKLRDTKATGLLRRNRAHFVGITVILDGLRRYKGPYYIEGLGTGGTFLCRLFLVCLILCRLLLVCLILCRLLLVCLILCRLLLVCLILCRLLFSLLNFMSIIFGLLNFMSITFSLLNFMSIIFRLLNFMYTLTHSSHRRFRVRETSTVEKLREHR